MDNSKANHAYTPLVNQEQEPEYAFARPASLPPQSYPLQNEAYSAFPPPIYPPQNVAQGYPQYPQELPQAYPPGTVPQAVYPPHVVPMEQMNPQQVVVITEEPHLLDATPFVPPTETLPEQIKKLPKFMFTAISNPKVATFSGLKMNATWGVVWFILLMKLICLVALELILYKVAVKYNQSGAHWYASLGGVVVLTTIFVLVYFFASNGIYAVFAKCLGGSRPELATHPTFLQYCYVTLLIDVPISIIGKILSFIPIIGGLAYIALLIYSIILGILGMKAVYHLTTGQAIGVILFVALIALVIALVLVFTVGMAFVTIIAGAQ